MSNDVTSGRGSIQAPSDGCDRATTAQTPLPETGFLRLWQIIGNPKADPPIPALVPVSKSTWWAGVKSGRYPKSVRLGPRIAAWRVEDVRELIGLLAV